MSESPKHRFNKTIHAKSWTEFADGPQFKAAADAAMLQHGVRMGTPKDMAEAAANEFRRQGARDFLDILASIAILSEPETKSKTRGVDHSI